jgi:hypothetical protein
MEHSKDGCDPREELEQPPGTFRSRDGCSRTHPTTEIRGELEGSGGRSPRPRLVGRGSAGRQLGRDAKPGRAHVWREAVVVRLTREGAFPILKVAVMRDAREVVGAGKRGGARHRHLARRGRRCRGRHGRRRRRIGGLRCTLLRVPVRGRSGRGRIRPRLLGVPIRGGSRGGEGRLLGRWILLRTAGRNRPEKRSYRGASRNRSHAHLSLNA